MSSNEEWRTIRDFPDYSVSSAGRVISYRRARPHVLAPFVSKGYELVALYGEKGQRRVIAVHKLVASAFLGPRPDGLEVRHLDGNSLHNSASNLLYGTKSENALDTVRHGTHYLANKTHCRRGHAYSDANTYVDRYGHRSCRTCRSASRREWEIRKAFAAANVTLTDVAA